MSAFHNIQCGDPEATQLLANLPTPDYNEEQDFVERDKPNATILIDSFGRLAIYPEDGGWLGIEDLSKVHGDLGPFAG